MILSHYTMNFCNIYTRTFLKSSTSNLRNYSAICCNIKLPDRSKRNFYSMNKSITRKLIISDNVSSLISRNFSIQGLVDWQTQIYTSASNSTLVHFMQDGLLNYHELTGLPWWSTIVTSTVLIRMLMTFPLAIYQNYILAKVENIGFELRELVEELKRETAIAKHQFKLTDKKAMTLYRYSLKKQWKNLIIRDNCHPLKASLLIWVQIPVWICMSFALRNLVYMTSGDSAAYITFLEMSKGGIGWIPNLVDVDHSLILPIAFGLLNLSIIEIQRMSKLREPSKLYNIFTNGFRILSIVMIPVAASVPSCMCLYWVTSSSVGLVQNLVLLSPAVRRKLRIPLAPSELENPYSHIKEQINLKIHKLLPKKS